MRSIGVKNRNLVKRLTREAIEKRKMPWGQLSSDLWDTWNKGKHGIYSEETKRRMVRRPTNA